MPLQATSGAASYDAFGGGVPVVPNYIEDVFSTYLYTGTNANITINNGIDLATYGGLTWFKSRSGAFNNALLDTARGTNKALFSNSTAANSTFSYLTSFNSNGVTFPGGFSVTNNSGATYALWTFRKQPKFFDVVTYTGNGVAGRTVAHSLGSAPGCVIVKRTDTTSEWKVCHFDGTTYTNLALDTTGAAPQVTNGYINQQDNLSPATTIQFDSYAGSISAVNANGGTYVAYLFASNAGGFGLTGTDNVISCGSYTGTGAAGNIVTLGYEPQWIMIKRTDSAQVWTIYDNMRGIVTGGNDPFLIANYSDAETTATNFISVNATGFSLETLDQQVNGSSGNYIYIAIRRGPMKVPTSGTSVFAIDSLGGTAPNPPGFNGVLVDWAWKRDKSSADDWFSQSRLTGTNELKLNATGAATDASDIKFDYQDGWNTSSATLSTLLSWMFKRAPSFLDVVCYTGTGANRTVTHNLQAVPELIICKTRSGVDNWAVYSASTGATKFLILNLNFQAITESTVWNNTSPTSTQFTVGTNTNSNGSGSTYVAYLFATCAGVSKVGSYTGTGATQTISCGFTGGARFVLIKRTDTTGAWYVWDTKRGMVSGTDPSLLINSTAAEVNANSVYTTTGGFQIVSTAAGINASGGTFIFLAIA